MLHNDWDELLKEEFSKDYFVKLTEDIKKEYATNTCYPLIHKVFDSLRLTSYQDTKVLLLGQDPYHQPNQAMGLSFSVQKGVPFPPSLQNIFAEYSADLNLPIPKSGDLTPWGKEGVLLLNAILSVRESQAASHEKYGWTTFTDAIIRLLNEKKTPMVFVLWGNFARNKKSLITNPIHLILENVHPSPLSAHRGFFGSRPFSIINAFLASTGQTPIRFDLSTGANNS